MENNKPQEAAKKGPLIVFLSSLFWAGDTPFREPLFWAGLACRLSAFWNIY